MIDLETLSLTDLKALQEFCWNMLKASYNIAQQHKWSERVESVERVLAEKIEKIFDEEIQT